MRRNARLEHHPYLRLERGRRVAFYFNHKRVEAYANDTVGAALFASGQRIFSRSFKYHRPRGLFCMAGNCPNCLMRVDGVPNVPVCVQPVREGTKVQGQNAWPSLDFDILSVTDRLGRLFPIGFQYKRFIRPKFLWPLYARILRQSAGIGTLPSTTSVPSKEPRSEMIHTDIAVVGAGLAGAGAALRAAEKGLKVTVVEETPWAGGKLRYQTRLYKESGPFSGKRGFQIAQEMEKKLVGLDEIRFLPSYVAFGYYAEGILTVAGENAFVKIQSKRTIFATGSHEKMMIFENNDLPGVFLSTGARRLLHIFGVKPGERAVVAASENYGLELSQELGEAGINIVAIVDSRPQFGGPLEIEDTSHLVKGQVTRAIGRNQVSGAVLRTREGRKEVPCDMICTAAGFQPSFELPLQVGCPMRYDEATAVFNPVIDENFRADPECFVVGEAASVRERSASQLFLEGEIAGLSAAVDLGKSELEARKERDRLRERMREMS